MDIKRHKVTTSQSRQLNDRRILITAGPTWVPIDSVRVISNTATGLTGILLASEAIRRGAKVTLLLGPGNDCCLDKAIKVIRFKFFEELKNILAKELRKKYDILIHSAAVSDYRLKKISKRKISSQLKNLSLKLSPTPKLIDAVKKIQPSLFLVGFKFEPGAQKAGLIRQARSLIRHSGADLVVANTGISRGRYNAYIVNKDAVTAEAGSKDGLAKALLGQIGGMLCRNLN